MDAPKQFEKKYPPRTLILILFFFTGLFLICFAFLDFDTLKSLVREDEIIENTQAILYLMGAGVWGFAFYMASKTRANEKRRLLFYILFLGLFLFFFFEEISWGQRLFGFSTPEGLEDVNMQNETTIHNIEIQNSLTWIHLLMGLFLAMVGIIFPILKLGYKKAAKLFERFQFPVLQHDLIACFGMPLVIYSDPGFQWFVPLLIFAIFLPIIMALSGKFRDFFDKFKYPLFQFSTVAVIGSLVIAINIDKETAHYLTDNVAFEVRELLIAMALFSFAAFEAHGAWKRKLQSSEVRQ